MSEKQCSKCKNVLPLNLFCKDRTRVDGLFPQCKKCKSDGKKRYYENNKESVLAKTKEWHKSNPSKVLAIQKNWREENKESLKANTKKRRQLHPDKFRQSQRNYYVKNREVILEKQKAYYLSSPEKVKQSRKKHRDKNKDRLNAKSREWYKENTSIHRLRTTRWRRNNPDKAAAILHRRRAKIRQSIDHYTAEQWQELKQSFDFKCLCCGKQEPFIKLTVDHIDPISNGGSNSIENIQPLCLQCNQKKGVKTIDYRIKE